MCQGFFFFYFILHILLSRFSDLTARTAQTSCFAHHDRATAEFFKVPTSTRFCHAFKNIYIYIKFILHSTNSKLKQAFSTKTFWRMTLNRFKKFSRVKYSMWKSSVGCCEEYVCGSGAPQLARSSVLGSCRSSRRFTWMLISNPDD